MTKETKLGLFILLGTIALAISTLTIKAVRLEPGYRIHIYFGDIANLLEKAWVRVMGVKVGKVERIELAGNKAKVTVWIKSKVKIHADARATITSTGLLGVKYLELTLGSEHEPLLKDGDSIVGIDPVSVDTMLKEGLSGLRNLLASLQAVTLEGKLGENLNQFVNNLKDTSERIKKSNLPDDLNTLVENLNNITKNLAEITEEEKIDIKATIKNLRSATEKLDNLLTEIEKGETIIAKLLSDKEMGDDLKKTVSSLKDASNEAKKALGRFTLFKTYWDYNLRYSVLDTEYKSDVGIQIRPKPEKFYYLGIINAAPGQYISKEAKNTLTFTIGRDFNLADHTFTTLYAGIIRSTGGLGLSIRPFWKWQPWNRLEFTLQGYDFTRKIQEEQKPIINIGAKIKPVKLLYLIGTVEDITETRNFHTSANLVIEDEDLAYLLALVGLAGR